MYYVKIIIDQTDMWYTGIDLSSDQNEAFVFSSLKDAEAIAKDLNGQVV